METIDYDLSDDEEFKDLFDMSIHKGTIISVDYPNNKAEVNIDDIGIKSEVPIFYHCEDNTTTAGATAFDVDDRVWVINQEGGCEPDVSNLKIVGFVDGLEACVREFIIVKCRISTLSANYYCFVWDVGSQIVANSIPSALGGPSLTFPCVESDLDYWKTVTANVATADLWTWAEKGGATFMETNCDLVIGCVTDSCIVETSQPTVDRPGYTDRASAHRGRIASGSGTIPDPCISHLDWDRERETYALSPPPNHAEGILSHPHFGSYLLTATTGPWASGIWSEQEWEFAYNFDSKSPPIEYADAYQDSAIKLKATCFLGTIYDLNYTEMDWEEHHGVAATYIYQRLQMTSTGNLNLKAKNYRTEKTAIQIFFIQRRLRINTDGVITYSNRVVECLATAEQYEDASIINPFAMTEVSDLSIEIKNLIEHIYTLFGAADTALEDAAILCEVRK